MRSGALVVARLGAEHREDMHRLLHHALAPLEAQLGVAPYAQRLLASRTMPTAHRLQGVAALAQFRAADPEAWTEPAEGFGLLPSILQMHAKSSPEPEPEPELPLATAARLHVQHAAVQSRDLFV